MNPPVPRAWFDSWTEIVPVAETVPRAHTHSRVDGASVYRRSRRDAAARSGRLRDRAAHADDEAACVPLDRIRYELAFSPKKLLIAR